MDLVVFPLREGVNRAQHLRLDRRAPVPPGCDVGVDLEREAPGHYWPARLARLLALRASNRSSHGPFGSRPDLVSDRVVVGAGGVNLGEVEVGVFDCDLLGGVEVDHVEDADP
jgi:hypothetical protein